MPHPVPLVVAVILLLLPLPAASAPPTGAEIFRSLGCRGCHLAAGRGGSSGPALDGIGARLLAAELRRRLVQVHEGTTMPGYSHLTEPERAALLDYLRTL